MSRRKKTYKKEIELDVYGKLYFDYLIAAKKDSDELLKLT